MPNHIQNKLEFTGDKKAIKKLRNAISGDERSIDFNKIVPMPKDLEIEIHSTIENAVDNALKSPLSDNPLLAGLQFQNRNNNKSPLELSDEDWNKFIQCLNNKRKYGSIFWYDWL